MKATYHNFCFHGLYTSLGYILFSFWKISEESNDWEWLMAAFIYLTSHGGFPKLQWFKKIESMNPLKLWLTEVRAGHLRRLWSIKFPFVIPNLRFLYNFPSTNAGPSSWGKNGSQLNSRTNMVRVVMMMMVPSIYWVLTTDMVFIQCLLRARSHVTCIILFNPTLPVSLIL